MWLTDQKVHSAYGRFWPFVSFAALQRDVRNVGISDSQRTLEKLRLDDVAPIFGDFGINQLEPKWFQR